MPILLLGSDNLAAPLRQLGQQVIYCGPDETADIVLKDPDPEWAVLEKMLGSSQPEIIILSDNIGQRCLPTGLWGARALTVFYGVDSPLNRFWQSAYANIFDIACLDQKTDVSAASHARCFWLPVGINAELYQGSPAAPPVDGVCFVGVVDDKLRPKRSAVLGQAEQVAKLQIQGGRQQSWFPTSQAIRLYQDYAVTLNENLFPGVTTRPLEVMAAGGCLFSEAAPGQMDEFFTHREHLYYYEPGDIRPGLKELLADHDLQKRLRRQGREAVMAGHTLLQRAGQLLKWIEPQKRTLDPLLALAWEAEALLMAGLRWPAKAGGRRLLRARGRLRSAVTANPNSHSYALLAQAEAAFAHWPQVVAAQNQAVALAGQPNQQQAHILNLGLAYHYSRQPGKARGLWRKYLKLKSEPDKVDFHLAAARILQQNGCEFSPGFNRQSLWPGCWYALEHLQHAFTLGQKRGEVLFTLGELLLRNNAPNQAYDCFAQATASGFKHQRLEELSTAARRQGYIL